MRLFNLFIAVLTLSISSLSIAVAGDKASLVFEDVYAYETAASQMNGATFAKITNTTDKALKIVKAEADVANMVELHTHIMEDDGRMSMFPVEAFEIPANGTHELKPTGDHIMLMMLNAPLEADQMFDVILTLDNEETFTVPVKIQALVAKAKDSAHDHSNH